MDDIATLSPEHYRELRIESLINDEAVEARGYRTLYGSPEEREELNELGFKPYVWNREEAYPGLLVPTHGADGHINGYQFKAAIPRAGKLRRDGSHSTVKYDSPKGAPLVVDVPAYTRTVLHDLSVPLWVTEGMKKTDSLVTQGFAAIGLTGVFNWRNGMGMLGDWENIPLKGREVFICFDADAAGNRFVQLAMSRLGAWLRSRGAEPRYVVTPAAVGDTETKGVDDFFAAGGTVEALTAAATMKPPGAEEKDAAFTDAFLVEDLAETLRGSFCWASGLGWLRWNGRVWKEVPDVEPLEAVRVWASEQFDAVCDEQKRDRSKPLTGQIAGWRAVLGKARLTALRDLSRGLIQRDAAEFDGDPDLLTCKNGTVHLPTGKLLPFNPEHCMTKMADAEYTPGKSHPQWEAALAAVPEDMRDWFQDRMGQALTGYPVPDHMLVIAHGGGSNGKSTVMNIIRRALADYGVLVSDRVLMASPDAHPTELMDFRGARYALMEETPEARHLNVQRLKTSLGTESIKARRIRQDPIEFLTSHSLFINTNYRPIVSETDHGTWRRLSLMPWPFTFRKPGQATSGPWERTGDPALAYAAGSAGVRAAALAWMVAGARAWYERGRMMMPVPERVERETRDWRAETDLILGFADEVLRFEPTAFTQTSDMLRAFNDWAAERGHRPWNDRTFASRFGSHDMVRSAKVTQGRTSVHGKQQRGWLGVEINKDGVDPFTGEREPEEPPEPPREYGGCICGSTSTDKSSHAEYCGFDPREQAEARTAPSPFDGLEDRPAPFDPENTDRELEQAAPVTLGFDLETAGAEQLFTGGHEGPFVRLGGHTGDKGGRIPGVPLPPVPDIIEGLDAADVIYGHNILGFDLLALAHHHGADYDALADKAVDTMVLANLLDPPVSKKMPAGYYGLDQVAQRLGHEGKTDDLKALAKRYGGYDKIPLDSREYQEYLRGDLAATKAVREAQVAALADASEALQMYACREMEVVALQNRATLNGWAMDTELLAERVAHEEAQVEAAKVRLGELGVPLNHPDRYRLKRKADWPEAMQTMSAAEARAVMAEQPDKAVSFGIADRIPGEPRKKPWASDEGREAIVEAAKAAGAKHWPRSQAGTPLTKADALGEKDWYDTERKDTRPGVLQVYGHIPAVRELVETVMMATGARVKYAEFAAHMTAQGRVHPSVGQAQGSGRWAYVKPSTSTTGKRGAAARERDVLIADPGHMMLTSDHSQLDVRTVAALSQDRELIAMLAPDAEDYHEAMAQVYFGDRSRRSDAKPINHGVNYGQGYMAIAKRNGLDPEMVRAALEARGDRFTELMAWTERVRRQAESGQLLDNGFGRPMRPDPERAFTQAPALMGQGASRDVMAESLLRLDKISERRMRPFLRGVIHDEIVLSVPEGEVAEWQEMLREAMTWEWRGVPILCDVSAPAFRWSECK